jgi:phosphoribosylformylglycinamidine synthase
MDAKRAGDDVFVVGETFDECGGGRWYAHLGLLGSNVPVVRDSARRTLVAMSGAVGAGLVRACHDLSDGGLAVAAAETAFAGDVGMEIDLAKVPGPARRSDRLLFSESTTRFLVETAPESSRAFSRALAAAKVPFAKVGRTVRTPRLVIRAADGRGDVVSADLADLRRAWRGALPFAREEATA